MNQDLPNQIKNLVDCLREQENADFKLTDIASVTEVLITTMQFYFKSIDTSIYRECRALSEYIANARTEIATLAPHDLETAKIPRAGMELDAIVRHTETATNTIMTSAETIMDAMSDLPSKKDEIGAAVMEIFEACSFQDITGQRISKVVDTLNHIEARVKDLKDLMGITQKDIEEAKAKNPEDSKALLQGPGLEGEGIDQSEVDALMEKDSQAATASGANSEDVKAMPNSSTETAQPSDTASADEEITEQEEKESSQDDIDALFG